MIRNTAAAVLLAASTLPAFAHLEPAGHGSFAAGFSHPLSGADHVLAMLAVGLWAALLGGRALWLVPTAFVATMAAGFGAAVGGLSVPLLEPVILASVVAIGLLAAMALRVPTMAAMAMVGFFAFFHGAAHGGELGSAGAASFAVGFAVATALLHGAGIAAGFRVGRAFGGDAGRFAMRFGGAATVLAGAWLAFG
ncbi:HupE/UreJ family protein [Aquibium sp. LZ166]|uniref:HupE/UreJ family protein n=1 Tax=Aquibium pacificus TaxID=3153579 RepID=A0ABV3SM17_9HYPH